MGAKFLSPKDDLGEQKAIVALATYPDIGEAKAYLEAEGYRTTEKILEVKKRGLADQVEKARQELAPQAEMALANDMLDNARLAVQVEQIAIKRTRERLEQGKVLDPSRVARDLSQVKTQNIDKRLALQGRPTSITEHRDVTELVNALVGMKVAEVVDSTAIDEPDNPTDT